MEMHERGNRDEEKEVCEEKLKRQPLQYFAAISANITLMVCGTMFGWTSPSLPKLMSPDSPIPITQNEATWIASLSAIGSMLGPFPAGICSDVIGRKKALLLTAIPFLLSWGMLIFADSVALFYASRLISGFSIGWCTSILPVYLSEIAAPEVRGALMVIGQILVTLGFVYVYSIGPFVSFLWLNILCSVLPIIFLLTFSFMPESPYYEVMKGNTKAAKRSLMRLRGKSQEQIEEELKILQVAIQESEMNDGNWRELLSSRVNRRALFLMSGLIIVQQLSGITVILAYSEDIFREAGSSLSPSLSTIIVGLVLFGTSLPGPYLIEKFGRRPLQLLSTSGITICQTILGLYFFLDHFEYDISQLKWLPLLSVNGYIILHSIGIGPVTWAMMGEMFAADVRSKCVALIAGFAWILGFISTKYFYLLIQILEKYGTFWLFSIICGVGAIFVYFFVPETKGKTLEKIQEELKG